MRRGSPGEVGEEQIGLEPRQLVKGERARRHERAAHAGRPCSSRGFRRSCGAVYAAASSGIDASRHAAALLCVGAIATAKCRTRADHDSSSAFESPGVTIRPSGSR